MSPEKQHQVTSTLLSALASAFPEEKFVVNCRPAATDGRIVFEVELSVQDAALVAFKRTLEGLDWFYYMSDNSAVAARGEAGVREAFQKATEGPDSFKQAFNAAHRRRFSTPSFVTHDQPYQAPFPGHVS